MIQAFKNLFSPTPIIQKMAGASITILGPLPSLGQAYALEKAIRDLNLLGWMRLVNGYDLEMELHGPFQSISELLQKIDHGTILQDRPRYEMMWLPHSKRFDIFTFNSVDRKVAKPR
jgi:hypothetical protein